MSDTLTVAQAAVLLGLSEVSIRKYCQRPPGSKGHLPAHKFGKAWAIEPPDLEAFVTALVQDKRSKLYMTLTLMVITQLIGNKDNE